MPYEQRTRKTLLVAKERTKSRCVVARGRVNLAGRGADEGEAQVKALGWLALARKIPGDVAVAVQAASGDGPPRRETGARAK